MMTVKTRLICLKSSRLLIFLLFLQLVSPRMEAQPDAKALDALIKQNQKALGKDIAVLVNQDAKTIYKYETEEFKMKTAAPIGQGSMWLTAAVVMVMVDEGKISLDDKVSKYLPIFEKYLKGYITFRQCLAHTTGIESEPGNVLKLVQRNKFPSLEAEVEAFASKREIQDNAGTGFNYSVIGPNIAARALEVMTRKSFDRLAQEKLFRPLNMRNTSFYAESGAINPAGGAASTANDYMIFLTMLMNKGMHAGKQILSEASVAELLKPQFTGVPNRYTPPIATGFTYTMGSWIQDADPQGNPRVHGCPGLFGFWAWIDWKRNYAAVILPRQEKDDMKRDFYVAFKEEVDVKD